MVVGASNIAGEETLMVQCIYNGAAKNIPYKTSLYWEEHGMWPEQNEMICCLHKWLRLIYIICIDGTQNCFQYLPMDFRIILLFLSLSQSLLDSVSLLLS